MRQLKFNLYYNIIIVKNSNGRYTDNIMHALILCDIISS